MVTERKALPVIDQARCTGCGWCVAACPPHVLSLAVQGWSKFSQLHDEAACTGCAQCAVKCPFGVIAMVRVAAPAEPPAGAVQHSARLSPP
jgi:ferredoxin